MKRSGARPRWRSVWKNIRNALGNKRDHSADYRDPHYGFYTEEYFRAVLRREEKRSERSGKPCLLMIFDVTGLEDRAVREVARIIRSVPREADMKGWWRRGVEIGILFVEIGAPSREAFTETEKAIEEKIRMCLNRELGGMAKRVVISCRMFLAPAQRGSTHCSREKSPLT